MVTEMVILFTVQNLQQGGRGIALIVAADLVDFINQHQRILKP